MASIDAHGNVTVHVRCEITWLEAFKLRLAGATAVHDFLSTNLSITTESPITPSPEPEMPDPIPPSVDPMRRVDTRHLGSR